MWVRSRLQKFDETHGFFTSRIDEHPELGIIDYVHIPLFILRKHFPNEFQKVCSYNSYAVMRDPYARFPSSFSQYLKKQHGPIQNLSKAVIVEEIDKTIKFLQKYSDKQAYLPHQYIHFQGQVDFIYDGSKRLVDHVYDTSKISDMLTDIGNFLGVSLEDLNTGSSSKANQSLVYRNSLLKVFAESIKPMLKQVLKTEQRARIRNFAKDIFYIPRDKRLGDIFDSRYIHDFISTYYAEDIKLYKAIRLNDASRNNMKNPLFA
jgi:hypothetical protein